MNIYGNTEIESSDADLLYYHTQVEEDGIITGPDAVNVVAHGENNDAYQRIRTAVHEQYHPRNTYQHILADRIADTIWRAKRRHRSPAPDLAPRTLHDGRSPQAPREPRNVSAGLLTRPQRGGHTSHPAPSAEEDQC